MLNYLNNIIIGTISVLQPIIFYQIVTHDRIKVKLPKLVVIISINVCIYLLLSMLASPIIGIPIIFVISVFTQYYIYKVKLRKSFSIGFIHIILFMSMHIFISVITDYLKITSYKQYPEYIFTSPILSIILSVIFLAITFSIRKQLNIFINARFKTKVQIIILFIMALACISSPILNINLENVMPVITIITILIAIKKTLSLDLQNSDYHKLLKFMTSYESEIERQRIATHERKNQLMIIKGKIIDREKPEDIINYIDCILDDHTEINNEKYAKFQYLPPNGLKSLFYFKTADAESSGINVSINLSSSLEQSFLQNLSVRNYDQLVRILGIYLDNAIEASINSEAKSLGIEIYAKDNQVKIIITNSFIGIIDDKVGNKVYSTKGANRGHGLMHVKHILSHNPIFKVKRQIINNLYIQYLIIDNPDTIEK